MRRYVPGDRIGIELPFLPCFRGMFEADGGVLRYSERRGVGRYATYATDMATGTARLLATTAGPTADGDADHLLVADNTCTTAEARIVTVADGPATPAESRRRCLAGVRAPRRVIGRAGLRIPVRIRCPHGCAPTYVQVSSRVFDVDRFEEPLHAVSFLTSSHTLHLRLPADAVRPGHIRIRVEAADPSEYRRVIRRRVHVVPPRRP